MDTPISNRRNRIRYRALAACVIAAVALSLSWRTVTAETVNDDGSLPAGTTIFDDTYAGISRLDGDLREALTQATTDAAAHGTQITINSGWRSAAYQQKIRDRAIKDHGSEAAAARWVASPEKSTHVVGLAVDVGPTQGQDWLSHNGFRYGLCQTYRNEPWHFEMREQAQERGCPEPYADPTSDPRMRAR